MALFVAMFALSILSASSLTPTRISRRDDDGLQQLEKNVELKFWKNDQQMMMGDMPFNRVSSKRKVCYYLLLRL